MAARTGHGVETVVATTRRFPRRVPRDCGLGGGKALEADLTDAVLVDAVPDSGSDLHSVPDTDPESGSDPESESESDWVYLQN